MTSKPLLWFMMTQDELKEFRLGYHRMYYLKHMNDKAKLYNRTGIEKRVATNNKSLYMKLYKDNLSDEQKLKRRLYMREYMRNRLGVKTTRV